MSTSGPKWLGIGAMRCGSTFFANCLRQHSAVAFGLNGRKEQRHLQLHQDGRERRRNRYLSQFAGDELLRGEWSARYFWMPQSAANAAGVLEGNAPVIVALRDPLERYESHQRLAAYKRKRHARQAIWQPAVAQGLGQLIGDYAHHLRVWQKHIDQSRFLLFTFEEITQDTESACSSVWSRLGLSSEPFSVEKAKRYATPSEIEWQWPPGVRESLIDRYKQQLELLESDWGRPFSSWIDNWQAADQIT